MPCLLGCLACTLGRESPEGNADLATRQHEGRVVRSSCSCNSFLVRSSSETTSELADRAMPHGLDGLLTGRQASLGLTNVLVSAQGCRSGFGFLRRISGCSGLANPGTLLNRQHAWLVSKWSSLCPVYYSMDQAPIGVPPPAHACSIDVFQSGVSPGIFLEPIGLKRVSPTTG